MKKSFYTLFFLLFLFNSCCINKLTIEEKNNWNKEIYGESPFLKNQTSPKKIELPELYDAIGYVFTEDYAPFWGKRFTPTLEEIRKAESVFYEKNKALPQFDKINFRKRYRQYIGNYENDKKVIEINFIKINKNCIHKSEYGYLLNKMFINTSDYKDRWKTIWTNRIVIE